MIHCTIHATELADNATYLIFIGSSDALECKVIKNPEEVQQNN